MQLTFKYLSAIQRAIQAMPSVCCGQLCIVYVLVLAMAKRKKIKLDPILLFGCLAMALEDMFRSFQPKQEEFEKFFETFSKAAVMRFCDAKEGDYGGELDALNQATQNESEEISGWLN